MRDALLAMATGPEVKRLLSFAGEWQRHHDAEMSGYVAAEEANRRADRRRLKLAP